MLPIYHFVASLILFIVVFPVYKYWSFLVFLGGFLIDVDHYLYDIFKFKSFSIKKSYWYHRKKDKKEKDSLHIFHVWEFWLVMLILSFYNKLIFLITFSMFLHLLLDFIDLIFNMKGFENRAFSLIGWVKRRLG